MNHSLTLSQIIAGYVIYADARHMSPHTIADYKNTFRKLTAHFDADPIFTNITRQDIQSFLAAQTTVTKKTILNYHTGLSALWTWAIKEEYASDHIIQNVDRPEPEKRAIVPFTEEDLKALMAAIPKTASYTRPGKAECANTVPAHIAERNRAIILLLLDTGMRATELCELPIYALDQRNRRVKVFGKRSKERILTFCARTAQVVWRYIQQYRSKANPADPLFVTGEGTPLDRFSLANTLESIGKRASVKPVNPHRFRHTFAISYLRNGGDPWTLQAALGHETMDMVRIYLGLAQADLSNAHKKASPVDNWKL